MTDLSVKTVKLFGGDYYAVGSQTEIAEFGSAAAGSAAYSVDPDDIQTAAYEAGWEDALIVDGTKRIPQKQDFNALAYLSSYFLSYLYRSGIAEYKATSTYNNIGIVREPGTTNLYKSLVSDNTGNALSDATKWTLLGDLADLANVAQATETDLGVVELATNAEVAAGVDNSRVIVPAALASLFGTSVLGTNSYTRKLIKVSGAFVEEITQYGEFTTTITPGGSQAITFPLTFPNNLRSIVISINGTSGSNDALSSPIITARSTSGFTVKNTDGDSNITSLYWQAFGN